MDMNWDMIISRKGDDYEDEAKQKPKFDRGLPRVEPISKGDYVVDAMGNKLWICH